jgi:pyridoxine kinase
MSNNNNQPRRVLSIQSHVVHGYVGNKAAVFPLQLLGFDVDFINSVQFSNHTGYPSGYRGQRLAPDQLDELFEGLALNQLLSDSYSHLLTGYVGSASFLNKLADLIQDLKSTNPHLIYLCDPVLGDDGKLYVSEDLIDIYRSRILPLADIITPNRFELELIHGRAIKTERDLFAGIETCHRVGCQIVIITTVNDDDDESSSTSDNHPLVVLYASDRAHPQNVIKIESKRLVGHFTGTGDAFAAMLLAWYAKLEGDLASACEHACSAMIHILTRTNETRTCPEQMCEIKLIQSKCDIEEPRIVVKAVLIPRQTN